MKKKMFILVLALVIAAVAIVCTSCAKKEETFEKGKVSYTIGNNTGKNVTAITLSDMRSENKMESIPDGGLADGESVGIELPAMLEKNAPDVLFSFTVEGGNNLSVHISQKSGTITMLTGNDGLTTRISEPGK